MEKHETNTTKQPAKLHRKFVYTRSTSNKLKGSYPEIYSTKKFLEKQ